MKAWHACWNTFPGILYFRIFFMTWHLFLEFVYWNCQFESGLLKYGILLIDSVSSVFHSSEIPLFAILFLLNKQSFRIFATFSNNFPTCALRFVFWPPWNLHLPEHLFCTSLSSEPDSKCTCKSLARKTLFQQKHFSQYFLLTIVWSSQFGCGITRWC
jgi:hypothetical protein